MKKLIAKNIIAVFFTTALFTLLTSAAFAAPNFSLRPSNDTYSGGDDFEMEILIDSDGEEILKARAVIVYDPTYIQIVKAERNNTLFEQFPTDEQTTDNTNGVIMLTGFTQSGSGDLYVTEGEPDVFGRVTFKPLWDGEIEFDFEFSGQDEAFKSVMIVDGSPPQNALTTRPGTATIRLVNVPREGTGDSGPLPDGDGDGDGDGNGDGQLPVSGIFDDNAFVPGIVGILGGVMVFVGSGILYQVSKNMNGKYRTVVDIEDDDK